MLAPALLLTSSAGEPPYEALCVLCDLAGGVLHPLDGLSGLVGHLSRGFLRTSALLLAFLTLLLGSAALGGAGLLDGLLGLGGRGDLQVEEAPAFAPTHCSSLSPSLS